MKTILIEKKRTKKIEFSSEVEKSLNKVAFYVLFIFFLFTLAFFIQPIIVLGFSVLSFIGVKISDMLNDFSSMEYELGDDLLDQTSVDEFRESFERVNEKV